MRDAPKSPYDIRDNLDTAMQKIARTKQLAEGDELEKQVGQMGENAAYKFGLLVFDTRVAFASIPKQLTPEERATVPSLQERSDIFAAFSDKVREIREKIDVGNDRSLDQEIGNLGVIQNSFKNELDAEKRQNIRASIVGEIQPFIVGGEI